MHYSDKQLVVKYRLLGITLTPATRAGLVGRSCRYELWCVKGCKTAVYRDRDKGCCSYSSSWQHCATLTAAASSRA